MLWKCCTQYASQFGKLSSGHRTGKGQFSFQSQRTAMPKNVQTTAQLRAGLSVISQVCSLQAVCIQLASPSYWHCLRDPGTNKADEFCRGKSLPFAMLAAASGRVSPATWGCGPAVSVAAGQHRSPGGLLGVRWWHLDKLELLEKSESKASALGKTVNGLRQARTTAGPLVAT